MKVINRKTIIWPKGQPTKAKDLEFICSVMGNEAAFHFFVGLLGFRPKKSSIWKRYDWILFLKGYIFNVINNTLGEQAVIKRFNEVFVCEDSYFHHMENQWYI